MSRTTPPSYSARVQKAIDAENSVAITNELVAIANRWTIRGPKERLHQPETYVRLAEAMVGMDQTPKAVLAYKKAADLIHKLIAEDKRAAQWRAFFLELDFGVDLWCAKAAIYELWHAENSLTREYGEVPNSFSYREFENYLNSELESRLKEINSTLSRLCGVGRSGQDRNDL
jgi:hypothetical protein